MKVHHNKILGGAKIALLAISFVSFLALSQEQSESENANPPYPSNSAHGWLVKMSDAMETLNYTVSFVLLKPGVDSQPYVWRHGVNEFGIDMEQLNLLNGPGKEVVRIGNKVSYFEPDVPPYTLLSSSINGPFLSDLFQHPEKLISGYDFVMVGRSRISGRAAQQIRIVSKDKTRYGFNVWLDQETGLLLKLNMFNKNAQLLEQIQVTGLQVTKELDPFFAKIEAEMLPEVISFNRPATREAVWDFTYLPVGMSIVKRDVRQMANLDETIEYIMLSDGLIDVSVYIHKPADMRPVDNLMGTFQSDTLLTIQQGELNVTVIGKLPAATANAIASSIQRVN